MPPWLVTAFLTISLSSRPILLTLTTTPCRAGHRWHEKRPSVAVTAVVEQELFHTSSSHWAVMMGISLATATVYFSLTTVPATRWVTPSWKFLL